MLVNSVNGKCQMKTIPSMTERLLFQIVVSWLITTSGLFRIAFGGVEEFRFIRMQICVLDEANRPVEGCSVKAYSEDWPIVYPFDGFAKTNRDGVAAVEIPQGRWTVVAGGGGRWYCVDRCCGGGRT